MSHFKAMYFPVEGAAIVHGTTVINQYNEVFAFDEELHEDLDTSLLKPAALCLVKIVYNQNELVGQISPKIDWIKHGDTVLFKNAEEWLYCTKTRKYLEKVGPDEAATLISMKISPTFIRVWRLKCNHCDTLH